MTAAFTFTIPTDALSATPVLHAERNIARKEFVVEIAFDGAEVTGPGSTPTGLNWSDSLRTAFAYTPPVTKPTDEETVPLRLPTIALPETTRALTVTVRPARRGSDSPSPPFREATLETQNGGTPVTLLPAGATDLPTTSAAQAPRGATIPKSPKSATSSDSSAAAKPTFKLAIPSGAASVTPTLRADRGVARKEYIIAVSFDGAEVNGPENTPTGLNWSASLKSAFAYTPPVADGPDGALALVELPTFVVPPTARAVELTVVPNLHVEDRQPARFSEAEMAHFPSVRATAPGTDAAQRTKKNATAEVASVKDLRSSARPQASTIPGKFSHRVVAEFTMAVPAGAVSVTPVLQAQRSISPKEYIIAVSFGGAKITGPESTPRGLSWSRTLKTAFVYSPPVDLADAQKTMPVALRTIPLPASTPSVTLSIIPATRTKDPAPSPFRDAIIKPVTAASGLSNDPPAPSLETLQERFSTDPTPLHLEQLVTHLWNVLGEITRPAAILHQHADLVSRFPPRAALLARQIADAADLQAELPRVPRRSMGAIATPVAERVLYSVHASPIFHSNGYAIRTRGVAEGMVANGRQVRVVGRPGYPWDVRGTERRPHTRQITEVAGVEYVHLPAVGLDQLPKGAYIQAAADALVHEALDFRPSVIQSASNSQTGLIALIAARRLGIPFVYEVRGLWEVTQAATQDGWEGSERYELDVALESMVMREADSIAVITRQLGDEVARRGADPDRISLVPNSVDVEKLQPLLKDAVYEPVPGLNGVPLIGFAGSIVAYEGLDHLIDAVGRLNAQGLACHLVIAGSGKHEQFLKDRVRAAGLDNVVHFLGRISHDDVRRLLASLDVIVCPRSANRVTEMVSPIKPLEAYAAGRVVLMSDVAPQVDLAVGGTIAPLFSADNTESLTDVLGGLLRDPELRRDYERRARLWVGDNRTWQGVCANLLKAHTTALTAHRRATDGSAAVDDVAALTIAVAGKAPDLPMLRTCRTIELGSDRESWRAAFGTDDIDALVIASDKFDEGWDEATLSELIQRAGAAGARTVLISEGPLKPDHPGADLVRLVDHVAITGKAGLDRHTAAFAASNSTLSTIAPTIDPRVVSPLNIRDREPLISVLGDSIPHPGAMDVARAHGLRVQAVAGNHDRFPVRLDPIRKEHLDLDQAILAASSGGIILRSADSADPEVDVRLAGFGAVEVPIKSGIDLDALDAELVTLLNDPSDWGLRAWESLRKAHRSSTERAALALLFRSAGIQVRFRPHPPYAVRVSGGSEHVLPSLFDQTVPPAAVVVPDEAALTDELRALASAHGVVVSSSVPEGIHLLAEIRHPLDPELYEDLLIASSFSHCSEIRLVDYDDQGSSLVALTRDFDTEGPVALHKIDCSVDDAKMTIRRPSRITQLIPAETDDVPTDATPIDSASGSIQNVLIAGHDLKFVGAITTSLEEAGVNVERDVWRSHTGHDEKESLAKLAHADAILCEWGLGNAVWYSHHKRSDQRLIIRVHLQEISTPHLRKIKHDAVDAYVFVSEIVRSAAVSFHGVPREKSLVVPNAVDVDSLRRPKEPGAEKTIGFVGPVPQRKRLDLAIDILERVREKDPEYRLILKGKGPQDYPWMKDRPEELEWYREVYDRIEALNRAQPGAVLLEGHGDDMAEWYSRIGVVLSTSDFESFHYTIADGVSSGARPYILYWPGADSIYPRHWLFEGVDEIAQAIIDGQTDVIDSAFIEEHFAVKTVSRQLASLLTLEYAPAHRSAAHNQDGSKQ